MSDETGTDDRALAEAREILAEREWPVTITLTRPVQFGKESVEQLVFQRGTLGQLRGMEITGAPSIDDLILVASRLCGRPIKVIELLDPEDSGEVLRIAIGFFGRCRGVGNRL